MQKQKLTDADINLYNLIIRYYKREIQKRKREGNNGTNLYGVKVRSLSLHNWNRYELLWRFAKLDHLGYCEIIGENKVQLPKETVDKLREDLNES